MTPISRGESASPHAPARSRRTRYPDLSRRVAIPTRSAPGQSRREVWPEWTMVPVGMLNLDFWDDSGNHLDPEHPQAGGGIS